MKTRDDGMALEGRIFRPPSEARSLLLQITLGCSHNECVYCDMYRDKKFRPKPFDTVLEDIAEAKALGARFNKVFLCDGDALILPTRKLLAILEEIRSALPWVERVGTYGDTRSVTRKSVEELTQLREAGLGIVYHGVETGDEGVMEAITKGGTRAECIDTAERLREAGIDHSVILLLGIGSVERSREHASATASLLTEMDPPYCGVLTTTVVPGTPLAELEARGEFTLPGPFEMLEELRTIVQESSLTGCRFSTNHASNYLPIRSILPRDRDAILTALDRVLEERDPSLLKPEFLRGL